MRSASAATVRANRQVGWLITLCSALAVISILFVGSPAPPLIAQFDDFAEWWTVLGLLAIVAFLLLAALGRVLPMSVLRVAWPSASLLVIGLQLLSFAAYRGADPAVIPWVWLLEPTAVSLLAVSFRAPLAFSLSVGSGATVALSSWIFTGSVSEAVAVATPVHMSNIGFTVILYGIRNALANLHESETAAREAAELQARSDARAHRRAELSRFVHDDVLSVFTAALLFRGPAPDILRQEALHALTVLDAASSDADTAQVDGRAASDQLRVRLERVAPTARMVASGDDQIVSVRALAAVMGAAAEALRNAVRHAQAQNIDVDVRVEGGAIRAVVRDDGVGFDAASAAAGRLGLSGSIVGRMSDVAGGSAEVRSAPGDGTEVILTWMP
ncbi:hypothetical protein CQ047_06610 [Microbacterium sp. MYb72]|uniref:sensor histidine kinase n=1 Tax=Microbacterium sp. MYb72 TaxID=1848693 RepID=UPI000CFB6AF2|nr:ATP-binding protein [Microbacterium sp. MYb72]PRB10769.1 hypothetical protein CQ047_06610 [Microbacterium sp. MYb72]